MRVFSTLMSWSNEDKSCMRVSYIPHHHCPSKTSLQARTLTYKAVHLFGISRIFWDCELTILNRKNTLTKRNCEETQFVEKAAKRLKMETDILDCTYYAQKFDRNLDF